ncbi:MAG: hypothetical protein ACAI43_08460 [Phycisphaerae bacterium]|nr:hypothetical protein [Tepidisphaeraceae bacterium]
MNDVLTYLEGRAERWSGTPTPLITARLWAIRQHVRRLGPAGDELGAAIGGRLGGATASSGVAGEMFESANRSWDRLLAELDGEAIGDEADRETTVDAFFDILDALTIAGAAAGNEGRALSQKLFNRVVKDLYALEPVAHVAAALRTKLVGTVGLAELFCTGVAGYARASEPAVAEAREKVGRREFVPVEELVGADGPVSLEELARRLSRCAWYAVQWGVHQLRLVVQPAARVLRLEVHEGGAAEASAATLARGMDGWDVRVDVGREQVAAAIHGGVATVKLPETVDGARFAVRVRRSGAGEWQGLFGRAGQ